MKNPVALLLVLGLSGMAACSVLSPPQTRACKRAAALCKLSPEETQSCVKQMDEMTESIGKERLAKLASCIDSSGSCGEVGGCMAGTGMAAVGDMMNGFIKGVSKALQQ